MMKPATITAEAEARDILFELFRQADCDRMPRVLAMPKQVLALVDDATAQRIYHECAAEIERASGLKFEWI